MSDLGFDAWMSSSQSSMSESRFAVRAWRLIQRNPTSITIRRAGAFLDDQLVRVEKSNTAREMPNENAVTVARDVIIFGVKGHPDDAVADTDIQNGDEFGLNDKSYTVNDVVDVVGGIQAHCIRQV